MKKLIVTSTAVIFATATILFIARTSFANEDSKGTKNHYKKPGKAYGPQFYSPAQLQYRFFPELDTGQVKTSNEGC